VRTRPNLDALNDIGSLDTAPAKTNRGWNVGFIEMEVAVDTGICRAYHHFYSELYWRGTREDWRGEAVEILHDLLDQNIFLRSSNKNIRVHSQLLGIHNKNKQEEASRGGRRREEDDVTRRRHREEEDAVRRTTSRGGGRRKEEDVTRRTSRGGRCEEDVTRRTSRGGRREEEDVAILLESYILLTYQRPLVCE
jgi:hypothetical protein